MLDFLQKFQSITIGFVGLAAATTPVTAAAVAYYSSSGVGQLGNPQGWSGVNYTGQSVAFELTIDFTTAVDNPTVPINLWEAGATGSGAALVLDGDQLHFFAGDSVTDVVSGNHGLTATQNSVQIVSVYEVGAGPGTNELLSLYVNGVNIATGDFATANIWAGSDGGALGADSGNARYFTTGLFNQNNVIDYPEANIDFSVYRLASSGGNVDNTLANILVSPAAPIPEPSSIALLGLGGLLALRRRR
ncbi:MAG: PEP-CTERM sorting domain-containing protein [Akkermansiaceae bacterium]